MARIAVGGFQHETNTFATTPATLADFEAPDAWPGLVRGAGLFEAVQGINLPAAGFVTAARSAGHDLHPLAWCSAQPSGRVTRDAFETVSAMLLDALPATGSLDAVYLDLHGAMAHGSGATCASSRASTTTPTSHRAWSSWPTCWSGTGPIRTWTWPTPVPAPTSACARCSVHRGRSAGDARCRS
jgi:hypothetical protein